MLWGPSADNSLEEGSSRRRRWRRSRRLRASRRRRWRRSRRLRARKGNGEGAAPLRPTEPPTNFSQSGSCLTSGSKKTTKLFLCHKKSAKKTDFDASLSTQLCAFATCF